jgi:hypothetical protein
MTTKQQSDNSINEEVEEEVCDNTRERRREIIEAKVERLALLPDLEYQIERKPTARQLEIPLRAATIRDLADTLEDRSIVVQLQRKPKAAKVARLRKRDCQEFATLRRKASRWTEGNFEALAADPDPDALDSLVKAKRPKGSGDDDFTLPHWNCRALA